ncbi:phage holin family protein [soil metagenome]|jgi:putative membrane protein
MRFIINLLLTGIAALIAAYFLPGVQIDGIMSAVWLALVLAVLNAIVRPILVLLTIPVTILTLGLFLIVIDVLIILLASYLLSGFNVDGFLWALIFSVFLSIVSAIIDMVVK